jgi:ribonuclease VapC
MPIVIDTSALAAVVFGEDDAETFAERMLTEAGDTIVSAATLVEARIVVEARQGQDAVRDLVDLLDGVGAHVVAFDADQAALAVEAWRRFGKGRHPAALNFGDCFSYALAKARGAPLLFKGEDFAQTDIASAR